MISLEKLMTPAVITVTPNTTASEAISIMEQQRISSLVVVEGKLPVGIFTERSLLQLACSGSYNPNQRVWEIIPHKPITAHAEINIHEAYQLFLQHKIRHLIVVDRAGEMVGIATETDFLRSLGLEYFVSFNDITKIMTSTVVTLSPDDSVYSAMCLMNTKNISCIVIVAASKPVGIITERDIVRLMRNKADLKRSLLKDKMSHPVKTAATDISAHGAAELIRKHNVRRLVITDTEGNLAGVVTQSDIIKGLQSEYITQLKQVIDEQFVQLQTVRKQLNAKIILETMIHSSKDIAFVVTDQNRQVLLSNQMAENMFRRALLCAKNDCILKAILQEWQGQDSPETIIGHIGQNGKYRATLKKKQPEENCYLDVDVFAIPNDKEVQGYVFIAKDITKTVETERNLHTRSKELEETNAALRVLLKQRETDKEEMTENFQRNIETLVFPFFNKLRNCATSSSQKSIIASIENNLMQITSPLSRRISKFYSKLTPAELQVANLIKRGHSSKEIASLLNLSTGTVYTHRRNIRKKSGITNQKINLQTIFQQME